MSATGQTPDGKKRQVDLQWIARLAVWPTPTALSPATADYNEAGDSCNLRKMRQLATWATPAARDFRSESATDEYNQARWAHTRGKALSAQATLATWQSPTSGDAKSRTYQYDQKDKSKPRLSNEGQVSGAPQIGFPAPTGHSGQLNPAHSRWLMGYPPAWDVCAVTGIALCRRLPKYSSKHISKPEGK